MKLLLSFQVIVVVFTGVAIGAAGYHVVDKSAEALAVAQQCQASQANLTKELNERVLPAVQNELAALKNPKKGG